MNALKDQLEAILVQRDAAEIHVRTLGGFNVMRNGIAISPKDWGREASIQLFQFFITNRHRHGLHKEQIIDQIWGESDSKSGEQNFKVALHGINKVLEPERKSRSEAKYIIRQGLTYQLQTASIWLDVEDLDQYIAIGNRALSQNNQELAINAFYEAIELYKGRFLPNRLYEDWSTEERERIQLLSLGAFISLSELLVKTSPMESIRLAQEALLIDNTWEDAYRIQMEAYLEKGNRPMAIKTFRQCEKILEEEFGITPLPETKQLYKKITGI